MYGDRGTGSHFARNFKSLIPAFFIIMRNPLLQLIYNLLGYLALATIVVCLYCLARFLYFQPHSTIQRQVESVNERFTQKRSHEIGAGEFHVSESQVATNISTAPLCLRCHGNFCHYKSDLFRSYYNMHTFFLSCETCHIRRESDADIKFKWFDDTNGMELKAVRGEYQNYNAKIVPVRLIGETFERLDKFPEPALALDFMKHKDTYSVEQKETIKKQLMKHISSRPVTCEECHSKQAYLNYRELGYNDSRSADLSRIEIVKMIKEYNEFKFPLIFRSGNK